MIKFNSQVGQDKFVCEIFNYKKGGYFIDIGAFDGIQISNTYYIEKELGWSGLCIEPGKDNFSSLTKNRKCVCINNAITDKNGIVIFKELGTFGKIDKTGRQRVRAITIDKLLKDYNCPRLIDYISLDVEGSEYLILTKFPFNEFEVILWTIEHNSHLDGGIMKEQIREIMKTNNYLLVPDEYKDPVALFEDWFINKKHYNKLLKA